LGIAAGDILFILIAIYGLALLADILGPNFVLMRYLGGIYLIVLGVALLKTGSQQRHIEQRRETPGSSSFLAGLLITLGDQKAILFYLGFLPAFIDVASLSLWDTGVIALLALGAVAGPKLVYAAMADQAARRIGNGKTAKLLNTVAGGVMIGVGFFLLLKA
jgi:threonine/homoserine/homoserine lactone efflux protein